MSLTYISAEQDGLLLASASGLICANDIQEFHESLSIDPSIKQGMGLLFDATLADPTTNFADLRAAAADFHKVANLGVRRVAIVAPEGLVSGLAHVYSIYAEAEGFEVEVFEGIEEARAWLMNLAQASELDS